jgi:hypothetical protein
MAGGTATKGSRSKHHPVVRKTSRSGIVIAVGPSDGKGSVTCEEVARFCLDLLDGSLGMEERVAFEAHLAACGECVGFFESYRKTPELSRQAIALTMPPGVKETVRAFLRSRYRNSQD